VKKAKSLRPQWKVGLLTAVAFGDLTEMEADFLAVNAKIGTRRFIRRAHDRNKEVYIWTVNDPISMSVFVGRGADALITDEPALARDVFHLRSALSSFERLLLELAHLFGVQPDMPSSEDDG
jgi:glycerophosphoryl diester phosphodiesterase